MSDWKNFNIIYANGSSVTAGGGLEWTQIREQYKEKYNLEWEDEKDITYPKIIADHFGCSLIHDAQSGSGSPRLIRRVYEYIEKNGMDVAKKTLFLLQISDPIHRLDLYCNKIEDHLIVNVGYDDYGDIKYVSPKEKISPTDKKYEYEYFDGEITDELTTYVKNYHDPIVYTNKISGELIGLFSFLEQNKIPYLFMMENDTLMDTFLESYKNISHRKLDIRYQTATSTIHCGDISKYCEVTNTTIKDELEGFTEDTHPGYFGNQKYARELIKLIEIKIKPILYTYGDSFTQTFKSHNEGGSEWAKKYLDFKQNIPKSYNEIISENYGIELFNRGGGGSCNENIFDSIIEDINYGTIKEKDIVIVNWTNMARFRVANEMNNFANVIPFAHHPSQNEDMSVQTIEEIGINRQSYSVYWKTLINYMKIIRNLLPQNKIYFWTWDEPMNFNDRPQKLWTKEMIDNKNVILFWGWSNASEEIKNFFYDQSDLIIDARKKSSLKNIKSLVDNGLKITIINYDNYDGDKDSYEIISSLSSSWYMDFNYIEECYKLMIPFKKYQTIYDETKGLVDDKHYSEIGHKNLARDLIFLMDESNYFDKTKKEVSDIISTNWNVKDEYSKWTAKNNFVFKKKQKDELIKNQSTPKQKLNNSLI